MLDSLRIFRGERHEAVKTALLAAALFCFRADDIRRCQSAQDVQDVFSDPSKLKVVALLQHFLFGGDCA